MNASQYKAILDLEYVMVNMGWHPSIAGAMIRRAADRVFESGLGVQQTRRLQRELDPTIAPRVQTGGT